MAGLLLLLQQPLLDDRLGGDPRVVGAGHPEGVVPLHPPPADQDVLQRVVERVPQVQRPGDVRRRDDDRVGRLRARRVGVEVALFEPEGVPAPLGVLGVVLLGEVRRGSSFTFEFAVREFPVSGHDSLLDRDGRAIIPTARRRCNCTSRRGSSLVASYLTVKTTRKRDQEP